MPSSRGCVLNQAATSSAVGLWYLQREPSCTGPWGICSSDMWPPGLECGATLQPGADRTTSTPALKKDKGQRARIGRPREHPERSYPAVCGKGSGLPRNTSGRSSTVLDPPLVGRCRLAKRPPDPVRGCALAIQAKRRDQFVGHSPYWQFSSCSFRLQPPRPSTAT